MTNPNASRELAEQSRETKWRGHSFLRDFFLGRFRLDLLESLQLTLSERPAFVAFHRAMETFLRDRVDPEEIDETGEYPRSIIEGLAELGAFGMKIPVEYGGLGLSHAEYMQVMQLLGSRDANITALLSAHQAIGVPQPVLLFGTEQQKKRFLPRCARGAISAFALTEPAVGSDPARLATTARRSRDGKSFILDGHKLWCTNGTLAELIVVMARDPDTDRINAFVLEMDAPGVTVEHRCRFMGLRALANATIDLDHVEVPAENLLGDEGQGLKVALVTLNTGRLSLPAATAGLAKHCTEIVRKWSSAREQWGDAIGKHEAVADMNADIVGAAFAMDAMSRVVGALADRDDVDIRLEAAAAKEWNTVKAWDVIDQTLQVRGGRGYETARSLAARGELPIGVERCMRDARINRIFEGSGEIMHLFMAREAVDKHLQVAGTLVAPGATFTERMAALPKIIAFYAWWYPSLFFGWGLWPRFASYGVFAPHVRFAARTARRLARALFYGMLKHRAALEKRQLFLFRIVDIAMETFVLMASVVHARRLLEQGDSHPASVRHLTSFVASRLRRSVEAHFDALWDNDDRLARKVGHALLEGEHAWVEQGAIALPHDIDAFAPPSMDALRDMRRGRVAKSGPAPRMPERAPDEAHVVESKKRA